jgi:hypothetical protein
MLLLGREASGSLLLKRRAMGLLFFAGWLL